MYCQKRLCLQGEGTSDSNTGTRSSTYEKFVGSTLSHLVPISSHDSLFLSKTNVSGAGSLGQNLKLVPVFEIVLVSQSEDFSECQNVVDCDILLLST